MIWGVLSDLAPGKGSSQCFLDYLSDSGETCFHQVETLVPVSTHVMQESFLSVSPLKEGFRPFLGKAS